MFIKDLHREEGEGSHSMINKLLLLQQNLKVQD